MNILIRAGNLFHFFAPWERKEGFGDLTNRSGKGKLHYTKSKNEDIPGAGQYDLPCVKNFRLNKDGLPSYTRINSDSGNTFAGRLKGSENCLLPGAKLDNGECYNASRYRFNKWL